MEYEEEIIEMIRNIDNEEMRNAIYKLIMSVKDIKNVKTIYFLRDLANSFKKKWGS